MSIKLIDAVMDLNLGVTEKLVLIVLADNANDAGLCFPTIKQVCARSSCSERTVFRAIDELEKLAHLTIERRPGRGNLYWVHPRQDIPLPLGNPCQRGTPANVAPLTGSQGCQNDRTDTATPTPANVAGAPANVAPHRTVSYPSPNPKKSGAVDKSTVGEEQRKSEEWTRLEGEAREAGFRPPDRLRETPRTYSTALRNHKEGKAGRRTEAGRQIADEVKASISGITH